jgi:hypothetical protein
MSALWAFHPAAAVSHWARILALKAWLPGSSSEEFMRRSIGTGASRRKAQDCRMGPQ